MHEHNEEQPVAGQLQNEQWPDRVTVLQGDIASGVEALAAEVAEGKSARYIAYLEHIARFHAYSAGNQMLIYLQNPAATRVAGFIQWKQMGYWVAKGEHPIQILAPVKRKYTLVDEESGEERVMETSPVWYKVVGVYDVSQLNAEQLKRKPLPELFIPLGDDHAALANRVAQAILADGITLIEDQAGEAQGYSRPGVIALRPALEATNRVLTLFHEWAHEVLHQRDGEGAAKPRAQKELEAEATAYVAARHFGLRNPFSSDYLQSWGANPKQLLASLRAINQAAEHMITRVEPEPAKTRGAHDHRISSLDQWATKN